MITKEEADKLARLIRENTLIGNTANNEAILWAVNYHLPLVLWRIERPIDLINALVIAAFTATNPSICGALGLDRSLEIGSPLFTIDDSYRAGGRIAVLITETTPKSTDITF